MAKSTLITLKTGTRYLECILSEDERRVRADEAAEFSATAAQMKVREEALKAEHKSVKESREAKEVEAGSKLATYRRGTESRDVRIREEYDGEEVLVIRTDIEAVIERRKPTETDWSRIREAKQTRLSFTAAEQATKTFEQLAKDRPEGQPEPAAAGGAEAAAQPKGRRGRKAQG